MVSYFCSTSWGEVISSHLDLRKCIYLDEQKGIQPPTTTKTPQKCGKHTGSIAVSGSLNRWYNYIATLGDYMLLIPLFFREPTRNSIDRCTLVGRVFGPLPLHVNTQRSERRWRQWLAKVERLNGFQMVAFKGRTGLPENLRGTLLGTNISLKSPFWRWVSFSPGGIC